MPTAITIEIKYNNSEKASYHIETESIPNFSEYFEKLFDKIRSASIDNEAAEVLARAFRIDKDNILILTDGLRSRDKNEIAEKFAEIIASNNSSKDAVKNKILSKISNIDDLCGKFAEFLNALKSAWSELNRDRNIRVNKNFSFLLDTCYDDKRAGRLAKGLEALGREAVTLLAAAYAAMLANESSIEFLEWLPLLARASAKSKDDNAYVPVCPSRGDLAAVLYYLLLCCQGGTTS